MVEATLSRGRMMEEAAVVVGVPENKPEYDHYWRILARITIPGHYGFTKFVGMHPGATPGQARKKGEEVADSYLQVDINPEDVDRSVINLIASGDGPTLDEAMWGVMEALEPRGDLIDGRALRHRIERRIAEIEVENRHLLFGGHMVGKSVGPYLSILAMIDEELEENTVNANGSAEGRSHR